MLHSWVRRLPTPTRFLPLLCSLLIASSSAGAFAQDVVQAPAGSEAPQTAQLPTDFFSDVPTSDWAYSAVKELFDKGYVVGYPDKTYKGERPLTRYEMAIVVARVADAFEKQLIAGKGVDPADFATLDKLVKAYGTEIASIQSHLNALQQEADATQQQVALQKGQIGTQQGQIGVLQDFTRRAQIKLQAFTRTFAYGANINANCPSAGRPTAASATSIQTYCNTNGPGTALAQGARTASYLQAPDDNAQSTFASGQHNQGETYNYAQLGITGQPALNTAFLVQFSSAVRPSTTTGTSTVSPGYCLPQQQNFLNGNAAESSTLTTCNSTASQASYADGLNQWVPSFQNVWLQQSIPNSGLYLRVGHLQMVSNPYSPVFLGGDYFWGAMLGISKGPFGALISYGTGNSAATNLTLDNTPYTHGKLFAEADYTFHFGGGQILVTGMYQNYTGGASTLWDPSAVICTGTGANAGGSRYFANTAAVPFTTCGAGYSPITYTNGTAITGAYLSQAANNPTVSALTAGGTASFTTPGLATSVNQTGVLGGITADFGKLHASFSGSIKLGNDPYTGAPWVGNLAGAWLVDYGPWRPGTPGNHGHFTYETQGYAIQFNGLLSNQYPLSSSALSNSWASNFGSQYWAEVGVKYWTSDNTYFNIGYGRSGLLPNTTIPAAGLTCPGCVISGSGQNAGFLEYYLNI
jgi:hypothetical protein